MSELDRTATHQDLVRVALRDGLERLVANLPAEGHEPDAEAVHQARVATRRLRSDLVTLGTLLDPFRTEGLRRELAWAAGVLGRARDLDVLAGHVESAGSSMGLDPVPLASVGAPLQEERRLARLLMVDALCSPRARLLTDLLARFAEQPTWAEGVDPAARARRTARAATARSYERVAKRARKLGDPPADADLHEIRKRAKRCRYAAELFDPVAEGRLAKLADAMTEVQAVLGDLQDAVVAQVWLASVPVERLAGADGFVVGRLTGWFEDLATQARADFPAVWGQAARPRLRHWLD